MLVSIITLFAFVRLAFAAAGPAPSLSYCYENDLLRAFQHTSTSACAYCATPTGYPAFLGTRVFSIASLPSACSCFYRVPTEAPAAGCQPTQYTFKGVGASGYYGADLLITIDRSMPCGTATGGFKVTNICGSYGSNMVTYNPVPDYGSSDNCFNPAKTIPVGDAYVGGLEFHTYVYGRSAFVAQGGVLTLYNEFASPVDTYTAPFVSQGCGSCASCPPVN